jgi:acyl-CoA synthetase (AMP-forming)/AMP-acid ligase II
MTHPSVHARTTPNKIAYQMARSGKAISYRELDERSNQAAHLFRALGVNAGGHIAILMENRPEFMEICWAAQRSGLYTQPSAAISSGTRLAISLRTAARASSSPRQHAPTRSRNWLRIHPTGRYST